jgi:hypothetical protein
VSRSCDVIALIVQCRAKRSILAETNVTLRAGVKTEIEKLKKRSSSELFMALARQSSASAQYRKAHHVDRVFASRDSGEGSSSRRKDSKSGKILRYERSVRGGHIDSSMLDALGDALQSKPSPRGGQVILKSLWERAKDKICDDLDICEKFRASDPGLILGIWSVLMRGRPSFEGHLYLIVAVLAVRFGPDWMCDCAGRAKASR